MDDKGKIIAIMKETCNHAFLATCSGEGPAVRSVSPIIESDGSTWITTFAKSRKVKQISENPNVCLYFARQPDGEQTVKVFGTAKIIDDLDQKNRVWKLAGFDLSRYFPDGPESDTFCLLKIIPERIEWWENFEQGIKTYEP